MFFDIDWGGVSAPIFGAIASAVLSWLFARRSIPQSHRVAVIGFPQAGKTSLIVALFAFYFRKGIRGASVMPRGEETIRRVNAHIAEMETGQGVLPTTDQDLFAFRAEVQRSSSIPIFSRKYKLEIGDFPGEQSEEFINSAQPWLHNTAYFEWAMGADAFIFVVDTAKAISNRDNFVAKQKSAFRAAWQRINEHHIDGSRNIRHKTVVLVYTKADIILGQNLLFSMNQRDVAILKKQLDELFGDFRDYVSRDLPRFNSVLASVVNEDARGRLGIEEIANRILPKHL